MEQSVTDAVTEAVAEGLQRAILSNAPKETDCFKVKVFPVSVKRTLSFQLEKYVGTQVFHENCSEEEVGERLLSLLIEGGYRQAELSSVFGTRTILLGKRGTATVRYKKNTVSVNTAPVTRVASLGHNREKQYLMKEGVPVSFLVDLGVMNKDGVVLSAKYDKFRQMNRFLEFVEDVLPALPRERTLRILDFGCGKSYLTFALYYYLRELKGYSVSILGLDLKKDVILECNRLAKRYGYEDLHFQCGDIAAYDTDQAVDMVVTLHACDTATDYALWKAIEWKASVILSVPCCQHEWNRQMDCEDLSSFLRYGIVRERMSALMTDAFRANVLAACGYKTQLLEFIDMEHTPKNILIRAMKKKSISKEQRLQNLSEEAKKMMEYCKTEPTLYRLLTVKE